MKEDPGYYGDRPYKDRPKITWPGGKRLAFWVAPNIEFYELNPPVNKFRAAWPTPNPSVPGYSIRDYGNRVGHLRQMKLLDKYKVRGSISLSAALCEHHPEIIAMCRERDWEFFSHGIYNTRYTYGLTEAEERAMILDSMDTIERHAGVRPAGYLAPALSHSEVTLDLFAELGGIYTCDLFHDDQPTPLAVRSGKPFVSVPYSLEMNDTIAYVVNKVEPRLYGQMLKDCFDRLYAEGEKSGTVMCIPTHNYQVSCPHRLKAFEEALEYITGHDGVWVTTGREIAEHYLKGTYLKGTDTFKAESDLKGTDTFKAENELKGTETFVSTPTAKDLRPLYAENDPKGVRPLYAENAAKGVRPLYGMDHDRYDWSMLGQRKPVKWPSGKKLALWVNVGLQFFPLNPRKKPLSVAGNMTMPYPDLRHYTLRDYGNRVGIFRLLQAFDRYGVKPTFAFNTRLAERNPALLREVLARGDEIACHSWSMDTAHATGLDPAEEAALVKRSIDRLRELTGQPVRGWISPGKLESAITPELIKAQGIEYFCDWVNDEMPYAFRTANGPLWAMPLSTELEDRFVLLDNLHSAASWAEQVADACDLLLDEASREGGRILSLNVHPWVLGQPHRIKYLEQALGYVMKQPGVWSASASEILDAFVAQQ